MKMLTRTIGVLAFIIGAVQLTNDEFLIGIILCTMGLYLFRVEGRK